MLTPTPGEGLRVLYVSPLKALNYDVERNLRGPLAGLQSQLRVAVRTGDTTQKDPLTGAERSTSLPLFVAQTSGPRLIGRGDCSQP